MKFEDHFSQQAAQYAAYRPRYPRALFEFVAGLTARHGAVLDCGTGSGQAAIGMTDYFDRVIATDPSEEQIRNGARHPQIEFRVARAEASGLPDGSVNLVTAAQALHWFDTVAFFAEAKRVLAEHGAIAVWGYGDPCLDSAELERTLHEFNRGRLEKYWPAERQILLDGFRNVQFPFTEVATPRMELTMRWNLFELAGYLRTWSATARYVNRHRVDPVTAVEQSLASEWGDRDTKREVRWPLYIRAGKL
ncbi:MAG: class I SAM-dependent methyltransferase [Gemmatimonadaceae bacterium]